MTSLTNDVPVVVVVLVVDFVVDFVGVAAPVVVVFGFVAAVAPVVVAALAVADVALAVACYYCHFEHVEFVYLFAAQPCWLHAVVLVSDDSPVRSTDSVASFLME